jgi:ribosomal protein S18 acetylase RimI-like enzyme
MSSIKIEIITGYDEKLIAQLVELQKKALPPHMQITEPATYYKEGLQDRNNINVIMRDRHKVIGYLLGIPQGNVYEELRHWDPEMGDDPERLYLDMIQVLPEERRNKRGLALIQTVCAEAEKRNLFKLSMHARTNTGWSKYLQNLFADIRFLRQIENWYDFGEPCDYLEATTSLNTT